MFAFKNILHPPAIIAGFSGMYMCHRQKTRLALAENINLKCSQAIPRFWPNEWTHMHSVEVYKDSGGVLGDDWQLIKTYKEDNGYFGAAYINQKQKHVVVAQRSSQDLSDWHSNFDIITRNLNEQEAVVWNAFAKIIVEQYGDEYSYSFLAVVASTMAAYIILKQQENLRKMLAPNSAALHDKAKSLLDQAILTNPNYLNTRLFLAILYYDTTKYTLALAEVDNTLLFQVKHTTTLMGKGLNLAKLNKRDEALEHINQAKELASPYANLSWLQIDRHIASISKENKNNGYKP